MTAVSHCCMPTRVTHRLSAAGCRNNQQNCHHAWRSINRLPSLPVRMTQHGGSAVMLCVICKGGRGTWGRISAGRRAATTFVDIDGLSGMDGCVAGVQVVAVLQRCKAFVPLGRTCECLCARHLSPSEQGADRTSIQSQSTHQQLLPILQLPLALVDGTQVDRGQRPDQNYSCTLFAPSCVDTPSSSRFYNMIINPNTEHLGQIDHLIGEQSRALLSSACLSSFMPVSCTRFLGLPDPWMCRHSCEHTCNTPHMTPGAAPSVGRP